MLNPFGQRFQSRRNLLLDRGDSVQQGAGQFKASSGTVASASMTTGRPAMIRRSCRSSRTSLALGVTIYTPQRTLARPSSRVAMPAGTMKGGAIHLPLILQPFFRQDGSAR